MKLRHGALILSVLVCSGLVLAAYAQKNGGFSPSGQLGKSKGKVNSAELIRARANWFYQQRAYPLGHIPAFAHERAWRDFRQMQQAQRQSFVQKFGTDYRKAMTTLAVTTGAVTLANPWQAIGPQPTNSYFYQPAVSGRVSALVVDPCDTTGKTVFLGGAQGGLWKTTNGGASWTPLTDQTASLAVGSLAIPPVDPMNPGLSCLSSPETSKTIYVGTGEQNFSIDSYYGAGVLKCTTSTGSNYACTPDQTFGTYFAGNQTTPTNALNQYFAGPYVGGLAVDPQDSSIMLAAVWGSGTALPSGIWCSADAGNTWNHVFPSVTGEIGTAVAFDQAGYGYTAIGNLDGSGSLNGVYISTTAYPASPSTPSCAPQYTALSGLTNAAGGVSAMGRISFSVLSSGSSPADSTQDEVFAAVANASDDSSSLNGIFKSTDGGNTWSSVTPATYNDVCGSQCFYDIPITIDPRNSNVVYVGGSAPPFPQSGQSTNPGPQATIIATTDGGSSWKDVANNFVALNGPHVDTHAFAFAFNSSNSVETLYTGNDGGVWSTTNPQTPSTSQAWSNLNATLGLTQIYAGMSTNPSGWQYRTYLGAQDNGSQVLGPDLANPSGGALPPAAGPWAWNDTLFCGDGGITLVDPLIPSTVYSSCAYLPATSTTAAYFRIGKSIFSGEVNDGNTNPSLSYFEAEAGIDTSDNGNFVPPFAIDPEQTGSTGDAQTLYFGTCRVWQTTNGGSSWNAISPDVTGGSSTTPICNSDSTVGAESDTLTSLAVAPTNSNEVVTGSSSGHVFVSENANPGSNATWANVTGTGELPQRTITQVAVDPSNPSTLYATFSGFSSCSGCDGKGHVYLGTLTTTGTPAAAWTNISGNAACPTGTGNLPDIPVNAIVVDPNIPGQLFVGTDVGVYVGTLQGTAPVTGACWQPLGTGLPDSAVLSLTLNNASRTLIAGTHGRSAWAYSLGDLPVFSLASLSPASSATLVSTASPITMALTGNGFTSGSSVNWTVNGTKPSGCTVTPTPVDTNHVTASVPSSCLASAGVAEVSVTDSTQPTSDVDCNGTASSTNCLAFSVTPPLLTFTASANTPSPSTVPAGSSSTFTLTLAGSSNTASGTVTPQPCAVSPFTTTISCSYSPGTVSIGPSSSSTSTVTISTTSATPPGTYAIVVPTSPGAEYGSAFVQLTVTPAFQSSVSPSSLTVAAGSSGTTKLTLTGLSASATGTATLQTCTTSPSTTTISCSYSASSINLSGTSPQTVTVTIDTTARGAVPPTAPFQSPPMGWIIAVFGLASMLTFLLVRRRAAQGRAVTVRSRIAAAMGFALLAGLLVFSAACGGGGSSSSTPTGTAAGTYTVTVPITPSPSNGNPTVQLTVQ